MFLLFSTESTCVQPPFADEKATRSGKLDAKLMEHCSKPAVQLLLGLLNRTPEVRAH